MSDKQKKGGASSSNYKEIILGGISQNPVFIMVIGMCPVIAQSYSLKNAFVLGVATAFVLVFSELSISTLRKVIPNNVRVPAYIMIVAAFVVVVSLFMQSYMYDMYLQIGAFLSLIAVNCLIMSRLEVFSSKNGIVPSLIDSLSMSVGFVFAISLLGGVRELLVKAGFAVFGNVAGGFITLGFLIVAYLAVTNLIAKKIQASREAKLIKQVDATTVASV